MNLHHHWKTCWAVYSVILSVSFLASFFVSIDGQQKFISSIITTLIGIILLSFALSIPAYFNLKIWAFCVSFFVVVAAFSVLRFLLYHDSLGPAVGLVFFAWSLFLGFFVGAFLEALVRFGKYVQQRPLSRRKQRAKNKKKK